MTAPYDYMSRIPRPDLARNIQAGLMLGEAIGGAVQASRQQDLQKAFEEDLKSTLAAPSFNKFSELMVKYPGQAENIQRLNQAMSESEKESSYKTGIDIYTALENGNVDVAKTILDEQIAAGRNAGKETRIIENIRNKMDQDPKAAQAGMGLWLAGSDPKRWAEIASAFESRAKAEAERRKIFAEAGQKEIKALYAEDVERAGLAKTKSDIENNYSQISDRAKRLGLDEKKAAIEIAERQKAIGAIPEAVRKDADAAIIAAGTAEMSANELKALADRIDKTQFGRQGAFATAEDFFIDAFGGKSEAADIRKEFTRLRNSEIIKSLPPGPATDRDIAIFAEGYTKATADPARMTAYLRGASKLRDIEAKVSSAKADWLSNNGSMQRARRSFQAGDYTAQPGESFVDFQRRVAKEVNASYAEESRRRELFPVMPAMSEARQPAATGGLSSDSVVDTGILGIMNAPRQQQAGATGVTGGFTLMGTRPVAR